MRVKPWILVACASEWASPARLPRVLRRAGARVAVLTAPGRALACTRFADRVVPAPDALEEYVEALRAHLEETSYAWVLIADDPLLAALAARRHEPWCAPLLPIAGAHPWARALASKAAFAELAETAGLPVPPAEICHELDDARLAAAALGLPIMLKQSHGFAGLGVRLVQRYDQVTDAWRELAGGEPLVAQRFVDGPIGNTVFLMDRGRPVCTMSAFKVRTWPGPFGPSTARRFMVHPDAQPLVEELGALTGYHGFGALDWVLGADGRLHILELNARPVPTLHMGPLAGVDFARALADVLAGRESVQTQSVPPDDAPVYPMFPEDVYRASADGTLALGPWLPVPGRFSDVPWLDPRLLLYHLRAFRKAARV